nr:hypothetical protein [Zoogloeaceae bacterium]
MNIMREELRRRTAHAQSTVQPRFIRATKAPAYLGMSRSVFDSVVRPHVNEFPIGEQGIGFDRHELDEFADAYVAAHAIDKNLPARDDQSRSERRHAPGVEKSWRGKALQASRKGAVSGTSTRSSTENGFTKALALVRGQKQNATSSID